MKIVAFTLIAFVSLFLLSGCSTVATLSVGSNPENFDCHNNAYIPRVHSGIFNDIRFISAGGEDAGMVFWDFPFSLVADTVVLPYTIYAQLKYGNICGGDIEKQRGEQKNNKSEAINK